MSADFLKRTRSSLAPLNVKILQHPYLADAEQGTLPLEKVQAFAANQYYIIRHDAKSLALMASRAPTAEAFAFFTAVFQGDAQAIPLVVALAEAVGLRVADLEEYAPIPEAVGYAHYLTTLAHVASPGEQAVALIVNLPVWGSNCQRLSAALKTAYHVEETAFLDLFAQPTGALEAQALTIIEGYLPQDAPLRRVARLIQAYELMFWDGIYRS